MILEIELDCRLIVIDYMQVDRVALFLVLFNEIDRVFEHLGAQAELAAFINYSNGHNIAGFPLTCVDHSTRKSVFESLEP